MKKLVLVSAAMIASAVPAKANLVVSFFDVGTNIAASCADGAACDNGGQVNQVVQINQIVGNFQIIGTFAASDNNTLQASNLAIINQGSVTDTLQMLVGQTGFSFPVTAINQAASITFNNDVGATASSLAFFANSLNAQPTFGAPGSLLFTVSHTPTSSADAQSGVNTSPFVANSPFSMAEFASVNLLAGSDITGFAMTMNSVAPVPEPSTWAMILIGFASVVLMGTSRRKQPENFRLV